MEGQREYLERVFPDCLVISTHIHENSLFVCQLFILLKLVVNLDRGFLTCLVMRLLLYHKVVDMFLLLPCGPDKVALAEVFFGGFLPPVALL